MSVTSALDNPIERLGILPNAMNWRGGWLATEQYYQNDVVVSPVNQASYILNGQTALLGGGDPTVNPDWIELSATATGVLQVNAGAGITVTGTATIPVVNNDGVILLTTPPASGITLGGTLQNPIISNAGVISIANGAGIAVNSANPNQPIISNNGVLSVTAGAGIQIGGVNQQNPVVVNDGVLTVASAGAGITVNGGTGPNPTIQNDGVLSVTAGTGISVTGTAQNPIINSTVLAPVISKFQLGNFALGSSPPVVPAGGSLSISMTLFGLFIVNAFLNGTADPNGTFVFDFSGWCLYSPVPVGAGATIDYSFADGATTYVVPITEGGETLCLAGGVAQPVPIPFPKIYSPLSNLRGAGLTNITSLILTNNTSVPFYISAVPNSLLATYYPNGAQ